MKHSTGTYHLEKIGKVLEYVHRHLDEPLQLDQLASMVAVAPFHFHKIFRRIVGEPVQSYIRRMRLCRAADQLVASDRRILEIALDARYQSNEAFTRAFKRSFGVTPSEFRLRNDPSAPGDAAAAAGGATLGGIGRTRRIRLRRSPFGRTKVAFLAYRGFYCDIGRAWETFYEIIRRRGLDTRGKQLLGVVYSHPGRRGDRPVRYDACVEVDPDFAPEAGLSTRLIPSEDCVIGAHCGPMKLLSFRYNELLRPAILSGNPFRFAPPFYEQYRRFPFKEGALDSEIEIYLPLRRCSSSGAAMRKLNPAARSGATYYATRQQGF